MEDNCRLKRKRQPLSQANNGAISPKKKRADDSVKRAGTINRITLKNFMCHSLLDVDLSSNINMVIGRNGSGKSAILTALIVGLGGKASLTSRGNSVKSFIKAGKGSMSVEIELYNGGAMAYRPAIYGGAITVLRHVTSSGSGSYKIKNESGHVVASTFTEVQNITTSLSIQVDNPVCILNQDISRNFLNSNDPKHKFTLFMKATRLDTLAEEYQRINFNKNESARLFKEKQRSFQKFKDDMKAIKTKIDDRKSLIGIGERMNAVQNELLWSKARDAEEELQKEQDKAQSWEEKRQELLKECETRKDRIDKIQVTIRELNQQIEELKGTMQVQARPQTDLRRILDELRNKFDGKKREKQLIASTIEMKTKDVTYLRNEIQTTNEKMSRVEQQKIERLRDLNSKSEKLKGMEDVLQTSRNDLFQLNSDVARKNEEKQTLRREIARIEGQINNEKNSLNALENESGNTLLLYGPKMPQVKQLIEKNKNRFKHVPRGPLGSYIKLKEKKWAVAVESFIGPGLLKAFCVDNVQDNQLLTQIFNQVYGKERKPMLIMSKFIFKKHDVRPNLTHSPNDCTKLHDALEIEDAVAYNCIVDQAGIEEILLIPTDTRAQELLSNAAYVPKNCKQGVTIKGDRYYADPNYKTYGSTYHTARYLQVDTKEHMLQLQRHIEELTQKKQEVEEQYRAMCNEIREEELSKDQLEEKIRKITVARANIRKQLDELRATAEPEVASVDYLERELREIEATIQQKTAEMAQVEDSLKEIQAKIRENQEKLKQLRDANSSLEERMKSVEEQVREETMRQREISASEEFDQRKAKEYENRLNEIRCEIVLKQNKVKQYVQDASKSCGRPAELSRRIADITKEITDLQKSARKIENCTESIEELVEKYQYMLEKFNNINTLLEALHYDIDELKCALQKRETHYKLTENYFVSYIKHSFKNIMEVRQFEGSIEINMNDKKLDLVVIPQHGSQGLTTTSNLSGGERSFSTVAFLYSLWQCMEFPFYFLDEFDVYMDKLNRTKVIEILLHHAETHPELQFVFLTPQDVSFIKKNVAILRLEDPVRNAV